MVNWRTILSSFDKKGTLLKWLKSLENAIVAGSLSSIELINVTSGVIKLRFVFADETHIDSPEISIGGGGGGGGGEITPEALLAILNGSDYISVDMNDAGTKAVVELDETMLDDDPVDGSDKLVKSGGVYDAVSAVQNAKVNKSDSAKGIYGRAGGEEYFYAVSKTGDANTIVQRDTGGVVKVGTPTADEDAATKKYVDDHAVGTTLYRHIINIYATGSDAPCFFTNFIWISTRSTAYTEMRDIFNDSDICGKLIPAYVIDNWGDATIIPENNVSNSRIGQQIRFIDTSTIECQCFTELKDTVDHRSFDVWEPYISQEAAWDDVTVDDTVTLLS